MSNSQNVLIIKLKQPEDEKWYPLLLDDYNQQTVDEFEKNIAKATDIQIEIIRTES